MDILQSGVRAVVVPYETKGETEQRLRAELLAEKGLLTVVPEAELSPAPSRQRRGRGTARGRPQPLTSTFPARPRPRGWCTTLRHGGRARRR